MRDPGSRLFTYLGDHLCCIVNVASHFQVERRFDAGHEGTCQTGRSDCTDDKHLSNLNCDTRRASRVLVVLLLSRRCLEAQVGTRKMRTASARTDLSPAPPQDREMPLGVMQGIGGLQD